MEDYITRPEHEEFCRRIEAEEKRQNKRLDLLEDQTQGIHALALSVDRLANNMERMAKEQEEQGERLKKLESEPAEHWNSAKRTIITTIVSVVAGALAAGLIILAAQYIK